MKLSLLYDKLMIAIIKFMLAGQSKYVLSMINIFTKVRNHSEKDNIAEAVINKIKQTVLKETYATDFPMTKRYMINLINGYVHEFPVTFN